MVGSRVAIWVAAQLHLLFAAFVLAVPIFALTIELIGYLTGDRRYDEVAPIAFLIEQAGGLATDGTTPILEQAADALHARSPLVFGSPDKVRQVAGYYDRAR